MTACTKWMAGRRHAKHEGHIDIHRTHVQIQLWNVRWGKAINTSTEWRGLLCSFIEQLHHIQIYPVLQTVELALKSLLLFRPLLRWRLHWLWEALPRRPMVKANHCGPNDLFCMHPGMRCQKHFEAVANCTFSKSLWQVRIGNIDTYWHFIRLLKQMMKHSSQEPLNDCQRTSRVSRPVKEAMLPKVASSITKPQTWDCNNRLVVFQGLVLP